MNDNNDAWTRREQAIQLFAERQSGGQSRKQIEHFRQWSEDPANAAEYENLLHLWGKIGELRQEPFIFVLRDLAARNVRILHRKIAMAATVLALLCATGLFYGLQKYIFHPSKEGVEYAVQRRYIAGVGERLPITLADGSAVILDADSEITVTLSTARRFVKLDRGRAFFSVSKDPERPFIVRANGREVTAIGTEFSVERLSGHIEIFLKEGLVRVVGRKAQSPPISLDVLPGTRVSVWDNGDWRSSSTTNEAATAWMSGHIILDDKRLADLVFEFNRYSHRKMRIADPGTGNERLSGVLKAGDVDGLLEIIAILEIADAAALPNGDILLQKK